MRAVILILGLIATGLLPARLAWADDPDFIHFGAGAFDFQRDKTITAEFDLAYRSDYKLWILKPHGGVLGTAAGAFYAYGGFLVDMYFGNRIVATASTAVGPYIKGSGKDLGGVIEFRSGLDLAYRFDDRSRLGVGIYHMSNTGLWSKRNPGEETALLFYQMPVNNVFSSWSSPGGYKPDAPTSK